MQNNRWEYKPLSEVVEIHDTRRKPINAKERAKRIEGKDESSLFPYYGATGQVGYIDDYLTDGEYVLLGEDGAPFLDAFANKAYIITGKAWVNNHAHILRSKGDNRFLCYYLNHFDFHDYVSGTTRLKLTQEQMKKIPVPVLPIEEQQHIVARIEELFSQLDDAEATLQKTKAQLALYRQAVISSAYPNIPQEEWVRLDSIAEIIGGITKGRDLTGQKTVELPYLRVANVQNGYLDLSVMKTIELKESEKEHYLLKKGDVLYTEGGDRDKLGRGTVWHSEIPECVHQNHVFKARLQQDRALPDYVAYWSMSTFARNYFYEKGKQSVNLASINKTVLSALKLPIPSMGEQKNVVSEIDMRLSVCNSIEQTINQLLLQVMATRQSILSSVFRGE